MEQVPVDEALQYCLENPDNLSTEELLNKFPQHREELVSLLALDQELNYALPRRMPPESKALVKQRLMNRVSAAQTAGPQQREQGVTPEPKARQSQPRHVPWWRNRLVAGASATILLLFLWWSATVSLPGSPVYPVKLGTENMLLNFAGSSPALLRGHLNLSNVRLVDIRTMQSSNSLDKAGPALDNYQYHIRTCLNLWQEGPDDKDVDLARLLYASSVAGQRVLAAFGGEPGRDLPAELRTNLSDTLKTINSLQSSSTTILRGAGINLDQVLKESEGTVASLLAPAPGSPSPTAIAPVATATALVTPGTQEPTQEAGVLTPGVPALATLTVVLYAAQTTIAEGDSSNTAGIAAAETVVGGAGTPLSTPVLHAIQTVMAQPTFAVSVEPQETPTGLPSITVVATPQQALTVLPATSLPATAVPAVTSLPATVGRVLSVTPVPSTALPTLTVPLPTAVLTKIATVTKAVPPLDDAAIATLTPGAVEPPKAEIPTPQLPLPTPKLLQP